MSNDKDLTIEASMKSLEAPIKVDTNIIKSSGISRGDDISRLLNQAINLNDSKIIHEPTCLVCSSPYRADLEKEYIDKQSLSEVKKLFKEKTGKDVDLGVFKNHIDHHLESTTEIQKVEFANRVKRLYDQNLTTIDRISMGLAVITERVIGVNGLAPTEGESLANIEKIKSSETTRLMGAFQSLLKLQAQILGEMKSSGELMTIPQKDFVNIFIHAIQDAKTDKERETIKNILDKIEALAKKSQY
jgi:hypothetical protein